MDRFRGFFVERTIEFSTSGQPVIFYELLGGPGRSFIGKILNCFWCCGIWVAAIITASYFLFPRITEWICLAFALAAVQSLMHHFWFKSTGASEFLPISMKEAIMREKKNNG